MINILLLKSCSKRREKKNQAPMNSTKALPLLMKNLSDH